MSLTRVILVTGGNGALGSAIAQTFLDEPGAHVYLGVRTARERALQIQATVPDRCHLLDLEVKDPDAWKRAAEQIISQCGRLDVLVNNAGKHSDALLATMPLKDWDDVIRTNLDGAFHGCQAVVPQMMKQRSGRIINISSLSALLSPAGQTNYAAAKAGLLALTRSLAKEVARANITVNAICPGFIQTEALSSMSAEARQEATRRIPMRRFGRPEEVAAAVQFLACPKAGYITGSTITIDGGIY